jgi:hypothetical protein
MGSRLPVELRSGIVPDVLQWFIRCSSLPADSVDPRAQSITSPDMADFASCIRAIAARSPYEPIVDYMDRWWFLPEIFGERARVHRTRRSDHDRHLHDHPWHFVSVILEGGYSEEIEVANAGGLTDRRRYRPGDVLFRHAEHRHRLEIEDGGDCWSLVFTSHNVREWGFWTERGFVPWQQYDLLDPPA